MKLEIKHTELAECGAEQVWYFWSNPETWKLWDLGIEWCKFDEGSSFIPGGKLVLLPKGSPYPVKAVITECIVNKRFVDTGATPLGTITIIHDVVKRSGSTQITHTMQFAPNSEKNEEIFKNSMFKMMEKEVPLAVKKLAQLCEEMKVGK